MIKTNSLDNRKKIVNDLIKFNFNQNKIDPKKVNIESDYICLFKGVHKRLLHLFVQNNSLEQIMKDKTIIKYIWRQFGHYKYYRNKVLKTLNDKTLFENELNAIFKFIRNYIDEYNNDVSELKQTYKRNSTIADRLISYADWNSSSIPNTKLETRYNSEY